MTASHLQDRFRSGTVPQQTQVGGTVVAGTGNMGDVVLAQTITLTRNATLTTTATFTLPKNAHDHRLRPLRRRRLRLRDLGDAHCRHDADLHHDRRGLGHRLRDVGQCEDRRSHDATHTAAQSLAMKEHRSRRRLDGWRERHRDDHFGRSAFGRHGRVWSAPTCSANRAARPIDEDLRGPRAPVFITEGSMQLHSRQNRHRPDERLGS
jgi:hypothetical protein